ncbi:CAP domain-containing protein [Acrocarpospora phusangensis]|uniref:CAP domain-containing protein n=1 Tax=Acrocarpospora phusangensis TaxID=1070424 RepID=UPI00194E2B23|nr:CAP domain-containing protein [Acrocarpospora phusangensis]
MRSIAAALLAVSLTPCHAAIAHTSVEPPAGLKEQALREANTARARYGARPLTWNAQLYPGTRQRAAGCRFQPSPITAGYGENLYATTDLTGTAAAVTSAFASWMSEAPHYDHTHPGFTPETGNFSQVVWKGTTQLALSVARCPAGTVFPSAGYFVVARFTPPGNFLSRFAQNVGRPVA